MCFQGEEFAFASASAMAEATGKASCDGKVRAACCRANTLFSSYALLVRNCSRLADQLAFFDDHCRTIAQSPQWQRPLPQPWLHALQSMNLMGVLHPHLHHLLPHHHLHHLLHHPPLLLPHPLPHRPLLMHHAHTHSTSLPPLQWQWPRQL